MFCNFKKPKTADETLTLLASLCVMLFPFLTFVGAAPAEVSMSLTAILFLGHSALTRNWHWLREPWILCLTALWLFMMARGLFAENPHEAIHRNAPFVRYYVFAAALAFWVMRDANMRRCFLLSLTLAVSFIMFDGLFQYLVGYDIFGRVTLPDAVGHVRLTGPFGQSKPIMGVMLAWFCFPVCMHMLLTNEGKFKSGKHLAFGACFCLATLCMVALSGERMALLLALLGWVLAILFLKTSKRLLLGFIIACALGIGLMSVALPNLFERQVTTTINTFEHWQESPYGKIMNSDLQLAKRNPVFGLGTNHFRIACPTLYPNADKDFLAGVCNIHPHNIFLEWLIEEGIIGLALFILFIVLIIKNARRAWPVMGRNPLFIGWCIAFALRIWPIGSTTGFFSNWGAPPFWLALGMLLAYSKLPEERKTDDRTHLAF